MASPQEPGTSVDHTVDSGGLERTYRVHLPDGYDEDRAYPVVLMYHGRGKDTVYTEAYADLGRLPAIVVYPLGVVGEEEKVAWQGAPYARPGVNDVAFTRDLLNQVESQLCVDRKRVFATGKSNGAAFTHLLACRMSTRIAAIAPVAGAYYRSEGDLCQPPRPVPVLTVHGTGDTVIPYDGDGTRDLPSVQTWVRDWVVRNDCRLRPRERTIGDDVLDQRYAGCDGGADVRFLTVVDGGHTWPDAKSDSGPGVVTRTVSGSGLVWQFFRNHPLRSGGSR